jgi:hypothetical protein
MCDYVQLCNRYVREFLILTRTWFAFGLPSKTGCDRKSGNCNSGAWVNLSFKVLNASSCVGPKKRSTFLCDLVQRGSNGAKIMHELAVKSCKSKKTSNLHERRRCSPALNGFNLAGIHLNALRSNHITKTRDTLRAKGAFVHVTKQASSTRSIKNSTQMF